MKPYLLNAIVLTLAFMTSAQGPASAQQYPVKPIRMIVPNSPGSVPDTVGRVMGAAMAKYIGQPFVVENKAGIASIVGYEYVAKQPADGYNVVVAISPGLASLPLVTKDLRFDPMKDIPPFIGVVEGRSVLSSPVSAPWKTFKEMAAQAKANPGKFNYATPGANLRLYTAGLLHSEGGSMVFVPYPSAAPYFQAIASGDVHLGLVSEQFVASVPDKVRVIAVTGNTRLATFPDAPTFAELGHPEILGITYTLNTAAGTPRAVLDRLFSAASSSLQQQDVKVQFAKIQYDVLEPKEQATAAITKRLTEEGKYFANIAKLIGLKPE